MKIYIIGPASSEDIVQLVNDGHVPMRIGKGIEGIEQIGIADAYMLLPGYDEDPTCRAEVILANRCGLKEYFKANNHTNLVLTGHHLQVMTAISERICLLRGYSFKEVRKKNKNRTLTAERAMITYILHVRYGFAMLHIDEMFGNKRTNANYCVKTAAGYISVDRKYAAEVKRVIKILEGYGFCEIYVYKWARKTYYLGEYSPNFSDRTTLSLIHEQ